MKQFTIEAMTGNGRIINTYEAKSKKEALNKSITDGALAIINIEHA